MRGSPEPAAQSSRCAGCGGSRRTRRWLVPPSLAVAVALIPLVYLAVRVGEAGWDRIARRAVHRPHRRVWPRAASPWPRWSRSAAPGSASASAFLVDPHRPARPAGLRRWSPRCRWPCRPTSPASPGCPRWTDFTGFWAAALVLTLCSYPYVYLPVAAALAGADPAQEEVARSLGRGPVADLRRRDAAPDPARGRRRRAARRRCTCSPTSARSRSCGWTPSPGPSSPRSTSASTATGALVLSTVLVALTAVLLARRVAHPAPRRPLRPGRRCGSAGLRRGCAWARCGGRPSPAMAAVAALALGVPALSSGPVVRRRASPGPGSLAEIAAAAGNSLWAAAARGRADPRRWRCRSDCSTARAPGRLATALDRLTYLPHALPGPGHRAVPGVLRHQRRVPAVPDVWLLALAYAALFLPLAVGAVGAAAAQAPPALEEVARSLGRDPGTCCAPSPCRSPHRDRRRRRAGVPDLHEGTARHAAAAADRDRHARHRAVDAHISRRLRGGRALRRTARARSRPYRPGGCRPERGSSPMADLTRVAGCARAYRPVRSRWPAST